MDKQNGQGGGGVSLIDPEQKLREEIRAGTRKCDHVGYFVGHGFEIIQAVDGSMVGVACITCMMCGAVMMPKGEVIPPAAPVDSPSFLDKSGKKAN